jgi:hypothetical protein
MQTYVSPNDYNLYFGKTEEAQTLKENVPNPFSFTCPVCGEFGFSEQRLKVHILQDHGFLINY